MGVHNPVRDFSWPAPLPERPSLKAALDLSPTLPSYPTAKTELRNLLTCYQVLKKENKSVACEAVADIGMSSKWHRNHICEGYCPCLTKTRCESNGYWLFNKFRKPSLAEYFRLQGIPVNRLKIPEGVSERQVRGMIGNSFTVPVIARIMDRLFWSAGLTCEAIHFKGPGIKGIPL